MSESSLLGVTVTLLANVDTPASFTFSANVLEQCTRDHVATAGVAGLPCGTEVRGLEPGERDAAVGADVPIGGRRGILLNTDGGLVAAADAPVRRCNFCRLTLLDDGGRLG